MPEHADAVDAPAVLKEWGIVAREVEQALAAGVVG